MPYIVLMPGFWQVDALSSEPLLIQSSSYLPGNVLFPLLELQNENIIMAISVFAKMEDDIAVI